MVALLTPLSFVTLDTHNSPRSRSLGANHSHFSKPTARNFIVSPICAHSVHANAYVLSPERVITVQTEKNSYKPVLLSVDGGRAFSLRSGDSIEVRRSKFDTKLVRLSKRSFCEILQKKMLMGGTSNEE